METTTESEEVIDCRRAIDSCNIGLDKEKSCASVKRKTMTNKVENQSVVAQNGDLITDSSDLTTSVKSMSNGNVYINDEEVPHFECSKYSVQLNSNKLNNNNNNNDFNHQNNSISVNSNSVVEEYNDCISVDSEAVVITEEIGHELVISEEQVIYENTNEDETNIRTVEMNDNNDNSVCGDEDICDPEVVDTNNTDTNSTGVNVCNRFMPSIDFDGENSSLSESSSQQSSVSQPTPINLSNNTAMSVVQSFITAATNNVITSQSSQLNDSTNSSSISKKKFGKFRILNNEQNKGSDENLNIENSEVSIHSEESSIDSRFDRVITENLSGTQSESSLHDMSEHSSPNASKTPNSKSSKQAKRRGRPAGSTKKDRTPILPPMLLLEDDLNRRRSSRLKSLEERREHEKAIVAKHSDETNENSNIVMSDALEITQKTIDSDKQIDSLNNIKKKKKSKKDKTKKDKNKDSDSKKGKRKKKLLTAFDESKQNEFEDENSSKCKMLETYKNVSNIECFTPPLPPSHYANIKSNSLTLTPPSNKSATDSDDMSPRPEKVKSRWRRNSELESGHGFIYDHQKQSAQNVQIIIPKETEPPPPYDSIEENMYLFERRKSKSKKETRRMVCDCILTKEERARGFIGCGDDCLNRMLMIECGSRCSLGEHCANKRFQKKLNAKVEPYKTAKKGWGLRALEPLQANTFIMEYIGEVVDPLDFHNRVEKYSKEKRQHHYFMALKSDEIIDATVKGNITRFVNHSCDPNSETQKWTVNGDLRIGFFTQRFVQAGEEITFDYQFQRYGKEAQKCFCESSNCRGYIGATETADIFTDGSKITPKQKIKTTEIDEKLKEEEYLEDLALEEEITKLSEGGGLRSRQQVLMLARLMVRAEDSVSRLKLISIIKGTIEIAYLRLLLDYHGLQLIWSWMVDVDDLELKAQILEVLEILPIPNKTMLTDSKVFGVVERWSQQTIEDNVTLPALDNISIVEASLPEETNLNIAVSTPQIEVKPEQNHIISINDNVCDDSEAIIPVKVKIELIEEEKHEESKEDLNKTSDNSLVEVSTTTPAEESAPIEDVSKDLNETNEEIIQENKESSNDVQTSNKSSPRSELRSSSISMLIKPRSVNTSKPETPQTPLIKSKPNIAVMAQKLLINWKELKEVFRIPRLERQKRHEDEKEADRRTKEVEERRARGLPVSFDKRGIDDRDYTIAGILGIKRKGVKRGANDSKDIPSKKNLMSSLQSTNQMTATNSSVKVSREEHRKMFEMEVAQRDYQEALKRYHQELAYYNAVYGPQFQAHQMYSQDTRVREQYANTYNSYEQFYQTDPTYSASQPSSVCYLAQSETSVECIPVESEQISEFQEVNMDSDENYIFGLESGPVLIQLANFDLEQTNEVESSLAIDNSPHDMIVYGDIIEESTETDSTFDAIYPPPGVFYITPDGTNYFMPVPTDKKEVAVDLSVFDKVIIPYSSTFTETLANTNLPNNWRHNRDENGNIYYYNKITRKSQWVPPEEEKQVSPIIDVPIVGLDINQKLSDNEDSGSGAEQAPSTPSKHDEIDEPIDLCLDSAPPDSISTIEEQENPINSANSSPTLLQSIIALEVDPRKRRQLLNSVLPSTTTAAADTSSSLTRKKSCSSSRKNQEHFRIKLSQYVVHCLNPYRKPDCKQGRILNTEDFKHLARKLTHTIMGKEIKHCKSMDDLSCNEAVKHKTKDYVRKYMARFGTFYKTDNNDKVISPKEIAPNDTND